MCARGWALDCRFQPQYFFFPLKICILHILIASVRLSLTKFSYRCENSLWLFMHKRTRLNSYNHDRRRQE
jgi:hypothetical protein